MKQKQIDLNELYSNVEQIENEISEYEKYKEEKIIEEQEN